jgi:glutamate dehydrogenase/leucine dehydrogenase
MGSGRCHNAAVTIEKLASTDAFIVADLDGAPGAGIVRAAPKILVDGATLLARSLTYRFASFERQVGGVSSGINTAPDGRADAIEAYVTEVEPRVREGRVLLQAGKGVAPDELGALRAVDPRPVGYWDMESELTGLGIAVAAEVASGGLDGRAVAIEGFDGAGPALARAVLERGGRVVAVATAVGTAVSPDGFDPAALEAAWNDHGAELVTVVDPQPGKPWAIFAVATDVLVVGSKPGIVDDQVAGGVSATVVVPGGPVPVTAKGLAVLRRAGRVVVPDFISTAGSLFAGWPSPGGGDPAAVAAADIAATLTEVLDHEDGPLLAACYRAETYLRSWRDALPFGRPLA